MSKPQAAPDMKVVLVAPQIPGNTGTIGRSCVALDLELILIKPYGFDLSEKSLRRAGLDYWRHVRLSEYADWGAFLHARRPTRDDLFFFEQDATHSFYTPQYPPGAYLIFGGKPKACPPISGRTMPTAVFICRCVRPISARSTWPMRRPRRSIRQCAPIWPERPPGSAATRPKASRR